MIELQGTAKQIAYAKDIIEGYMNLVNSYKSYVIDDSDSNHMSSQEILLGIEEELVEINKEISAERKPIYKAMKAESKDRKEFREKFTPIEKEYLAKQKQMILDMVDRKADKNLSNTDSAYWIERYRHLVNYGK